MQAPSSECYGPDGKACAEPEAVARVTFFDGDTPRYWVKRGTAGVEKGQLFDPRGPDFDNDRARRFHSDRGLPAYDWGKASKETYESYLVYLRTGSVTHLRHAQRS